MSDDRVQELIEARDRMKEELDFLMQRLQTACSARECMAIEEKKAAIEKRIRDYEEQIDNLTSSSNNSVVVDKYLLLSNVRELLKTKDVKIGQIEKEAGCQPGYMSRLEKPGNTTEPSLSFVATAARMLDISIDALLSVNLEKMGTSEKYILDLLEKLKTDTIKSKLEWGVHSKEEYNNLIPDMNGYIDHPLFSFEVISNTGKKGIADSVFSSNIFGKETYINDNCYSLKLKNRSILYLMDIKKRHSEKSDDTAKEIWIYVPGVGKEFVVGNYDSNETLAIKVDEIFKVVNEATKRPVIRRDFKTILDSYMNDDFTDDVDDLPF